ncbi:PP2C family protein-serine/threonine phosphatase [Streptomyces amakusaensis]|uniref:PP2C family protein-serine/threonine phosphatase n=1 Tax=Streptomyces amakusaensis TaxID=67271 RepID=A0ABW0ASP6_9ACTN
MIRIRGIRPFPAVRRAGTAPAPEKAPARPSGPAGPRVPRRERWPDPARTRRLRRILPLGVPVACGAAALTWRIGLPDEHPESLGERILAGVLLIAVGSGLVVGARLHLHRELRRVRAVADATQQALLRPLPPRLGGLALAATRLSAGGDLYAAVATPYGTRVVIGDVRGHGLPAVSTVAAVLGGFREAAHDEPGLGGVLRRLERSVQRHLREPEHRPADDGEEFVTVLLLQIGADGCVLALNCGHPWPYRIGGDGGVRPLSTAEPLPPLGLFPLPPELGVRRCARLRPGETLFLHTDGAADARDPEGRFFPLEAVLAEAVTGPRPAGGPTELIASVGSQLLRHTGGRLTDDVAFLALHDDRARVPARCGETPRRTRRQPSAR